MGKVDELQREYAHAVNEYNLALGKMDSNIQRTLWKAAQDAAGKAFEYQERADSFRASSDTPTARAEAMVNEYGADFFRGVSHEFMRLTDTVPSFAEALHV